MAMQEQMLETVKNEVFEELTDVGLNDDQRREILIDSINRKDKDQLHAWILLNFGVDIPRERVCDDHCAPFDFVSDYLFGNCTNAIVLANRNGSKTYDFAILDAICAYLYDGIEIATVGAIQDQAKRCYGYYLGFNQNYPFSENVANSTMNKTTHKNASSVQILTGTMTGVNGPHPALVFLDEIDLMLWAVLQQALSMAKSTDNIRSRTVLTSTRKFGNGPMQRMIDEAKQRRLAIYQWCIWEVVEKLPDPNDPLFQEIIDEFGILPRNINRANGFYKWTDAIDKHASLDSETWETEWLCSKPGMEGIIYGSAFSEADNVIYTEWTPKDKMGYIYLAEDFGFGEGHPDVVLFCWVSPEWDRVVVFDELYMTKYNTNQIWDSITEKLAEYELTLADVTGWACDYHGLTEIADRQNKGAPILEKAEDASLYIVNNGVSVIKKFLETQRLMVVHRCINFINELKSYRKKKNLDGTYSKDPLKKDDHGPDAIRYLMVVLFQGIARQAFANERQETKIEGEVVPVDPLSPLQLTGVASNELDYDKPETYEMLTERF